MEPLSALSVAAAIVQFVDFGGTVISSTYAIYKSSSKKSEGTDSIISITSRLVELNTNLEQSAKFTPTSQIDREVILLCQQCNKAAITLLDALRELSGASNPNLWNSFKIALRSVWSQGEIDALQSRLESYRQQICMHILVGLRGQMQSLQQNNEQRDADINVSLEATQQLAKEILGAVDTQKSFQTDIIRAINRTNSWTGNYGSKTLDPNKLKTRDLDEFNAGILHILKFHEIRMRERTIADPHASTLHWIFEQSTSTTSDLTFADWLGKDVPFYWIAGKAGSGKSILMKHLYESPLLTDRLQQWAAGEDLRILCFYFWNAASGIQMSLQGLVRTLLFQALEQDRHYIPICFPSRFETRLMFPDEAVFRPPLTWDELLDALKAYLQEASKQKKLFLLIDGLDEFGGQPLEIINFVSTLPARRVKLCVSSRPWVAFEDAFRSKPSLRLDDCTRDDIRSYVEESFRANPGFIAREQLDPIYAAKIIDNVSEKASGVFLWVALVVRSLMEGFSGGERLSDLQARLDELPSDLEELFLKILNKLSPKQLQNSAQFFQMLRLARRQISSLEFSYADEEDAESIYKMVISPLQSSLVEARLEILRRRVNECCKGLIELSTRHGKIDPGGDVSYLHRTVNDFWNKTENKKRLVSLQGDDFNPYSRLCLSRIAMLKAMSKPNNNFFWDMLIYGIGYAKAAEGREQKALPELFAELARIAIKLDAAHVPSSTSNYQGSYLRCLGTCPAVRWRIHDEPLPPLWSWVLADYPHVSNFLPLATILRLKSYLDFLVKSSDQAARLQICSIALHFALQPGVQLAEEYATIINVAEKITTYNKGGLIKMLLKHGADPNFTAPATGRTAWETLWDHYNHYHYGYPPLSTARAFVDAGANPDALLSHRYKRWILESHPEGSSIFELSKQAKKRSRGSLYVNLMNLLSARPKVKSRLPSNTQQR